MNPLERIEALKSGEQAALAMEQIPFGAIRQSITDAWQKTDSPETREELWHEIKALDRVIGKLWAQINGAKNAAFEIKQDEQAKTVRMDPYERA